MLDGNTISPGIVRKRMFDLAQGGTPEAMPDTGLTEQCCHYHWETHGIIFIGVTWVSCSHQTSCGHLLCQLAPMRSMKDWSVGIGKSIVWWSGHSPQLWESQARDPALMNAQLFMQSRKVWQNRLRKSITAKWPTWVGPVPRGGKVEPPAWTRKTPWNTELVSNPNFSWSKREFQTALHVNLSYWSPLSHGYTRTPG